MSKTLLVTGATDGIGLATARTLVEKGHRVLLHGRNAQKLEQVYAELKKRGTVESYQADLADFQQVKNLAENIKNHHQNLDVIINNAGVYKIADPSTPQGLDVRFVVNALSPYLLTQGLMPLLSEGARIVNVSSAAQSTVSLSALKGESVLQDMEAYAQSKLALTMWSQHLGEELKKQNIVVVAVNPGSLLATKMVKEGFGVAGSNINQGSDILVSAALSKTFNSAFGKYFDNDSGHFSAPHQDASDPDKVEKVIQHLAQLLS